MLDTRELHLVGLQMFTQGADPASNSALNTLMASVLGTDTTHVLAPGDFERFYYTLMAKFLNTDPQTAKTTLESEGKGFDTTGLATYAKDLEGKTGPNGTGPGGAYTIGDIKWNADLASALLFYQHAWDLPNVSLDFLGSLQKILQFVTDPMNLIRVGALLLGAILLFKGASSLTESV